MISRMAMARPVRQLLLSSRQSKSRTQLCKCGFSSSGKYNSDITIIGEDEAAVFSSIESALPTKRKPTEPLFEVRDKLWQAYPPLNSSHHREAWIEDLSTTSDDSSNQIIKLHPDVWSVTPRLDTIQRNVDWQLFYKRVDYDYQKDRYEMNYVRTRRPWPQKGMGRARHATTTSPLWLHGGAAHGNKGPRTYFHMRPYMLRVQGLIHTLSAKFAQDDVRIVRDLDIPSEDPKFIEDLIDNRGWALSTLFVDKTDEFPKNLTAATMTLLHVNMMPAYGLNVHDMIKHKTLVLTAAAVHHIEERLLYAFRRLDTREKKLSASHDGVSYRMPYDSRGGMPDLS